MVATGKCEYIQQNQGANDTQMGDSLINKLECTRSKPFLKRPYITTESPPSSNAIQ